MFEKIWLSRLRDPKAGALPGCATPRLRVRKVESARAASVARSARRPPHNGCILTSMATDLFTLFPDLPWPRIDHPPARLWPGSPPSPSRTVSGPRPFGGARCGIATDSRNRAARAPARDHKERWRSGARRDHSHCARGALEATSYRLRLPASVRRNDET